MRELALHVLDILQNTVEADATHVVLTIDEDYLADRLTICVADDGRGMDGPVLSRVTNPFFTTRTTRHVGLGLPLLAAAAERAGGALRMASQPGIGTRITIFFQMSHPDRQPLGDIAGTLLAFLLSAQAPELRYTHRVIRAHAPGAPIHAFGFDTADIRRELGDLPLSYPTVQQWLAEFLNEGERELKAEG